MIKGVRSSDKLPIIAKLATDSEIEIINVLIKSTDQHIVKPLEIVQSGPRKFLVMQCYQTAANVMAPNATWWWSFAFALLQVCNYVIFLTFLI